MISDYLIISLKSLASRSKRTWLTTIGIFIGIAAVVALISLGQGLQGAIEEQFSKVGADKIFVQAKNIGFGVSGNNLPGRLTTRDVDVARHGGGVLEATGVLQRAMTMEFGRQKRTHYVVSLPEDQEEAALASAFYTFEIITGRMLRPNDRGKVVAGNDFYNKKLFKKPFKVGSKVLLRNKTFEVIGVLKKTGDPTVDTSMVITEEDAREITGLEDDYTFVIAQSAPGEEPRVVAADIDRAIRKDRHLKKGQEDFTVQTSGDLIDSFNKVFLIVQSVMIGIACISLLVGGINIMNTMYTTVLERTKEIGIMKAIGARNKDILLLFLIESGLLGASGGLIGISLGMGISKTIEFVAMKALGSPLLRAYTSWYLLLGMLAFAFVIGTLSGVLPARRAAKLRPVDALRYE